LDLAHFRPTLHRGRSLWDHLSRVNVSDIGIIYKADLKKVRLFRGRLAASHNGLNTIQVLSSIKGRGMADSICKPEKFGQKRTDEDRKGFKKRSEL
jgi:hypothetical protein